MVRLFIEGNELDVTADFSHEITYAIDDIQNVDSKKTAFSKTIVLAGTKKNNQLLGNIFEFANSNFTNDTAPNVGYNFNAMKSASIRLEFNGLQIMKGVMRLLSINVNGAMIEYEIALFGELGGLSSQLGNNRLEDLDFSEWNHNWTYDSVQNSWQGFTQKGIVFDKVVDYTFTDNTITTPPSFIANRLYIVGNYTSYFTPLLGQQVWISNTSLNNTTIYLQVCAQVTFDGTYTIVKINGPDFIYEHDTRKLIIESNLPSVLSKYFYPLIDYGNCNYTAYGTPEYKRDFTMNAFKPALYVHDYIRKILTNAGYTYESNFFLTSFFKSRIY